MFTLTDALRRRALALLPAVLTLVLAMAPLGAVAAPRAQMLPPAALYELTLPAALALMPDTPAARASGVWYADYALAARVYGVADVHDMGQAAIGRYFTAIVGLRPGPETGVSGLYLGRWRQIYGYDLLWITSEIYTPGTGTPSHLIAVDTGRLDPRGIGRTLAASGYARSRMGGANPLFIQVVTPSLNLPASAVNAIALGRGWLLAGAYAADVQTALRRIQQGSGTLGQDNEYRALAAALGTVQGAYLAANVPPVPFESPPGGHRGARLHSFRLYALGYQELRPGERYLEIALDYARPGDAVADAATLRLRLEREAMPDYGDRWSHLATVAGISVHGSILVARLLLRPSTSPTLWQDAILEDDLSILSP